MYGYIYLTTNLINDKKYIGKHISEQFDTKYYGSGKLLLRAIEKYGLDNFKCELLKECFSDDELNHQEELFIENYNCVKSDEYYNLKPGGLGKSVSGVIYIRNVITNECKKVLLEDLEEYLITDDWIKAGPIVSDIDKKRRADSNRGQKRSIETCKNISKSLKGRPLSEEHKKALRHPKSKPNQRKGMIQVNKDDIFIYIKKEDLQYYESLGYIKKGKKKNSEHSKNVSSGKKGKIAILNILTNQKKYIDKKDLDLYINEGWETIKKN